VPPFLDAAAAAGDGAADKSCRQLQDRASTQHMEASWAPHCERPQHLYLADPSLEALADCFATVGGVRLPLHSQLLAMHSAVLRELFLAQAEGGVQVGGCWRRC